MLTLNVNGVICQLKDIDCSESKENYMLFTIN